jgi:hypothetical protein
LLTGYSYDAKVCRMRAKKSAFAVTEAAPVTEGMRGMGE